VAADLESMPLSAGERDDAIKEIPHFAAQAQEACAYLRGATGPWRTKADSLVVVVRGTSGVVVLKSQLAAPGGRVCVGKVSVD
jgi:hypothetical protein